MNIVQALFTICILRIETLNAPTLCLYLLVQLLDFSPSLSNKHRFERQLAQIGRLEEPVKMYAHNCTLIIYYITNSIVTILMGSHKHRIICDNLWAGFPDSLKLNASLCFIVFNFFRWNWDFRESKILLPLFFFIFCFFYSHTNTCIPFFRYWIYFLSSFLFITIVWSMLTWNSTQSIKCASVVSPFIIIFWFETNINHVL